MSTEVFIGNGIGPSYSAAINAHAPAATPTDWFTIQGAANCVIRIARIRLLLRATAGTQYRISLAKYSVLFTGGTSAVVTSVPDDDDTPTSLGVVKTWSGGLPTVGTTLVGYKASESLPVAVLGTPAAGLFPIVYDFTARPNKLPAIRGAAQYWALNSHGVALPGGFVADVAIDWYEERIPAPAL